MGVGSFEKNQFSNVRNCTSDPGRLCHKDKHHLSDEIEEFSCSFQYVCMGHRVLSMSAGLSLWTAVQYYFQVR